MNKQHIIPQLAALFYYQSEGTKKDIQFEKLEAEKQAPFISLADAALDNLDKLNLVLVPKSTKNEAQVKALLKDRIEAEIRDFFSGLKVFKKGAIPQEELVARVWKVWENL